jgi:hypothetical protein
MRDGIAILICVRVRYQSLTTQSLVSNELNILHRVHYGRHHGTRPVANTIYPWTTDNRRAADTYGPEVRVHTTGCNYYHCCELQSKPSADERHRKEQRFSRGAVFTHSLHMYNTITQGWPCLSVRNFKWTTAVLIYMEFDTGEPHAKSCPAI